MKRIELHTDTVSSERLSFVYAHDAIRRCVKADSHVLAITDKNSIFAYTEFEDNLRKNDVRLIYGITVTCIDADDRYDVVLLAKNIYGRDNICRLVELLHQQDGPCGKYVTREQLDAHKDNLLMGSAAKDGQIIRAVQHRKSSRFIDHIISEYDYVEFLPEPYELSIEVYEAAKRNGVAVCAVQYAPMDEEGNAAGRHAFNALNLHRRGNDEPDKFRTAAELEQIYADSYVLPQEQALINEVLYDGPERIYSQIEDIPAIVDMFEENSKLRHEQDMITLRDVVNCALSEKFGQQCPVDVIKRVEQELALVDEGKTASLFLLVKDIADEVHERKGNMCIHGADAGLYLFYLLGITEFDPMSAEFDLPLSCTKKSPGILDGFAEIAMHKSMESLFSQLHTCGHTKLIRTQSTMRISPEDEAVNAIADYYINNMSNSFELAELKNNYYFMRPIDAYLSKPDVQNRYIFQLYTDDELLRHLPIIKTDSDTPRGLISRFWISNELRITAIYDNRLTEVLTDFETLSGVTAAAIPLNDHALYDRLQELVKKYNECTELEKMICGPFRHTHDSSVANDFSIFQSIDPVTPAELARVYGLAHGTNVWYGNAKELLQSGAVSKEQLLANREDVYRYLVKRGMHEEDAAGIMSYVRKGRANKKGFTEEQLNLLEAYGAEEWFIESCKKIGYMFPYAHAYTTCVRLLRALWYSMNYPEIAKNVCL